MLSIPLKKFEHPHKAYHLYYPAEWEQVTKEDGMDCGFGPYHRDDAGLWVSILPHCIDTEKFNLELPRLVDQMIGGATRKNVRLDKTLRQYGWTSELADKPGQLWLLTGGDIIVFASTVVPEAEAEIWTPLFAKVMASLEITRDQALHRVRVAREVLDLLRKKHPDEEFKFDDKGGIEGKYRRVSINNVFADVLTHPKQQTQIIKDFVTGLSLTTAAGLGEEEWADAKRHIIPVLKPRDYINPETPTKHMLISEWLGDIVICYVIQRKKFYRFVTGWDVNRWETTAEELHRIAIENLRNLPWPERMEGSRQRDGGRVVVVDTPDLLASSRLLHPELYKLFSPGLGTPFYAGIPDRETLVLYSNRKALKQRIARSLKKDYHKSSYQITPEPFLVTMDGVAPGDS